MEAQKINMLELIDGKRIFSIPVYQRNYDWKISNCERLFKDIENISKNKDRESHFLGTVVYVDGKKTASFREFIVIDGQQRLTSIMLLLKALAVITEDDELKEDIVERYLKNKRGPEEFRIKLKPIKNDAIAYEKILNNKEIENNESNMYSNYKKYLELLKESELTPEELFLGIEKLEIVYIALDGEKENPQLIFESLNSTGLDLTQADLIRNYLLMGQSYEVQENLYTKYWTQIEKLLPDALISDFVRDYLTLKTTTIPNKDKVYESFKIYFEGVKNYTSEGLLEELLTFAKYYSWFKYYNSPYDELNNKLEEMGRLKSTVVYPFLLNIFEDCFIYKSFEIKELEDVLDLIISYVLRRLVCELPNSGLNKVFCSLSKDIDKMDNKNISILEKVKISLIKLKGKAIFPNEIMLKECILSKDFYNFKQCKYFLYKIESYGCKEIIDENNLTIEHIMPQKLTPKWQVDLGKKYNEIHEKYLHKLGNLTLSAYNSELSNKSFTEKKSLLVESKLNLNKYLLKFNEWNQEQIENRALDIYNKALEIWKYPHGSYNSYFDVNSNKYEFDIMEEVNVTNREIHQLTILGVEYSIRSWREFFRTICLKMFEYDPQIFSSLVNHKDFKGRIKRIIDITDENMIAPYKISEKIYIEQHFSANDSLNYAKLVIEKFEGMENEISYKIR
ncbi:DUF262 domain-containing protein [Clostridium botulinum]|uniref:DUF262 domain-containing protein n=1 Tax=unclassified Clostridium TaxID=2614128 RepID=UPI000690F9FA|nr:MULTISPECIES: DUF262 domain-containing protein [unclassified Clostridium]MBY6779810.1 DUF262 domain-containing protein [Clostridium botulinum]MBY6853006.1 DUF262 domain-containing protein [Clostridium botulinum]MBY7007379.1 DUF262 domain-containing protein [Clostridium botulinum]NFH71730.1 DUF262 domain-containing protein [Clostridium botulinum]NFI00730.1 DUF262 domain-containing protein [Clostridium botulinum]